MAFRTVTCGSCSAEQTFDVPDDFAGRSVLFDCSSCQARNEEVVNPDAPNNQAEAVEELPEGTVAVADAERGAATSGQG